MEATGKVLKGRFVSPPVRIDWAQDGGEFRRADIEFHGVEQAGPSFEARVFLNNPNAGIDTSMTPENGYAGSFHVYGYGTWPKHVGKEAAAQVADAEEVCAPITKSIIATEAVRAALAQGPEVTVTVIPVFFGDPPTNAGDALKVKRVNIVTR